jgi:hypothetical protein
VVKESAEPVPLVPPVAAEQAEIAEVLANPQVAKAAADSPRLDKHGRPLVEDSTIAEIYAAAGRIGFPVATVQEMIVKKFGGLQIEELTAAAAQLILAKMKARAADGSAV